jgi:protein SMG5
VNNNPDSDESSDIITLLSGENLSEKKINSFNYVGILETIPVKFDQIVSFYASYKRR